jgi:hypothetical protein
MSMQTTMTIRKTTATIHLVTSVRTLSTYRTWSTSDGVTILVGSMSADRVSDGLGSSGITDDTFVVNRTPRRTEVRSVRHLNITVHLSPSDVRSAFLVLGPGVPTGGDGRVDLHELRT